MGKKKLPKTLPVLEQETTDDKEKPNKTVKPTVPVKGPQVIVDEAVQI